MAFLSRFFRKFAGLLLIIVIMYSVLFVRVYRVSGDSMSPTMDDRDIVFTNSLQIRLGRINRSDIVVYRDPADENNSIRIKRVIGLPLDQIILENGEISSIQNDVRQKLSEPYLAPDTKTCAPGACTETDAKTYEVPRLHFFVLGDNRLNSRDSRGCESVDNCAKMTPKYVPEEQILGKVWFSF